ncbi:DUF1499 domain-containing protein [Nitratireductor soli]|uniref:DUF1499 domain-containing protein n=1 Tax=Nitratireductor soli TaxID=1670619 RepID=UPI001FCCFDFA|nr:DUF1499 domain-containing protein [Nitratireductor soli]
MTSSLAHRFGLTETVPFFWLLGLAGIIAALGLAVGLLALVQAWEHGVGGADRAAVGIAVALCVLAPYGISLARLIEHPRLVDISTDIAHPPALIAAERMRSGAMNRIVPITPEAGLLQREHYPEITGRRYEHAAENVIQLVRTMMMERNWQPSQQGLAGLAGAATTIEGQAISFFLGFPADIAIRVEDDEAATFVDMRSASRYARHDLGDNARRIGRFLDDLDQRIAEQAGV